jgi:hypothetical protein
MTDILRSIYSDLGEHVDSYKLIFVGHSLGGFLSIMSAVSVFNNNELRYSEGTFKKAWSITFNPWFPPRIDQGAIAYYFPLVNYGTTCAFAFCVSGDLAVSSLYPACCLNKREFARDGSTFTLGPVAPFNAVQSCGFYYFSCLSFASKSFSRSNLPIRHSCHNFLGHVGYMRQVIASTDFFSTYADDGKDFGKKTYYNDSTLHVFFSELFSTLKRNGRAGIDIETDTVLDWQYCISNFNAGDVALSGRVLQGTLGSMKNEFTAFFERVIKESISEIRWLRSQRVPQLRINTTGVIKMVSIGPAPAEDEGDYHDAR